ncbi:MAG TPA: response regulator [Chryseosolibacter sp.]|nr:response regulator [Chryseosolibacter sp.]
MKVPGQILVVDDDEEDHEILRAACDILGTCNALQFFYNGHDLLDYLKTTKVQPFIILCDINMPHINGLDLREIIWKDENLRNISIPFIFFSTAANSAQVKQAYQLTVQGFFLKGNSMKETVRKLRLILEYWAESKHPNSY